MGSARRDQPPPIIRLVRLNTKVLQRNAMTGEDASASQLIAVAASVAGGVLRV